MQNCSVTALAMRRVKRLSASVASGLGVGLIGLSSAAALPPLGPAFGTDAPVPVQKASGIWDASIASDGQNLFAVFDEAGSIRGMLLDGDGAPLLPEMPFYADSRHEIGYRPRVAFGGDQYLLVWEAVGIRALRVGKDGQPVGQPLVLSERGYGPQLAWAEEHFVVSWLEPTDSSRGIVWATVESSGAVSQSGTITNEQNVTAPSMAVNADGYSLIAWTPNVDATNLGVQALIADAAGEVHVASFALAQGGSPFETQVVSDGENFLVMWGDSDGVSGALVSPTGTVLAALDLADGSRPSQLALGQNASGFVALWQDYDARNEPTYFARQIDRSGQLGAVTEVRDYPTTSLVDPVLLGAGDGYWFAYAGSGGWVARTDVNLEPVGEPKPYTLVQNSQNTSELLWDGTQYVLIWTDEREGNSVSSGRLMRIDTAGNRSSSEAVVLDDETSRGSWYAAATNGAGSVLIGWVANESRDVYTRVSSSDGTLGPAVKRGTAPDGGVSIASSSEGYLVVYAGTEPAQFLALEVDAAGQGKGEPRALDVPQDTREVRVLTSESGYLLQIMTSSATSVAGLSLDWTVGPLQPIQGGSFPMDTAVGGGKTAVVWTSREGERLARFWANGAWDGDVFVLGPDGRWGDTTWDGERFVSVWQDSEYFAHWMSFDLGRQVSEVEAMFEDEECNGPLVASNFADQYLLSCIRYNRDYSRRIVNYLVGEPLGGGVPDATSETNGDITTSDLETSQPEHDAETTTPAVTTEPVASAPGSDNDAPATSTTNPGETSEPAVQTQTPSASGEDSGCGVSPNAPGSRAWAALLGVALVAARRRRGASRWRVRAPTGAVSNR